MLTDNLSVEIKHILDKYKVEYEYCNGRYGKSYLIENDNLRLEITIDTRWIGYDFRVKHKISGKLVSSSLDTYNYPPTPKFGVGNKAVYNTTKNFVNAFLTDKVFVGHFNNRPAIAIPSDTPDSYAVTVYKRFVAIKEVVPLGVLLASNSMQPVKK